MAPVADINADVTLWWHCWIIMSYLPKLPVVRTHGIRLSFFTYLHVSTLYNWTIEIGKGLTSHNLNIINSTNKMQNVYIPGVSIQSFVLGQCWLLKRNYVLFRCTSYNVPQRYLAFGEKNLYSKADFWQPPLTFFTLILQIFVFADFIFRDGFLEILFIYKNGNLYAFIGWNIIESAPFLFKRWSKWSNVVISDNHVQMTMPVSDIRYSCTVRFPSFIVLQVHILALTSP